MIKAALEKRIGPVNDIEWQRACHIAKQDIRVNRERFGQRTSHRYLQMVLMAAIAIIRDCYPKEKIC